MKTFIFLFLFIQILYFIQLYSKRTQLTCFLFQFHYFKNKFLVFFFTVVLVRLNSIQVMARLCIIYALLHYLPLFLVLAEFMMCMISEDFAQLPSLVYNINDIDYCYCLETCIVNARRIRLETSSLYCYFLHFFCCLSKID